MHESIRKAARWTERIFAILGVILTAVIMTALLTGPVIHWCRSDHLRINCPSR